MTRWASTDLVAAAIRGDKAALDGLITAIWPPCYRLAVSLIGDRALAQDAAQESCAIVYRKISTVRSADGFDSWLYRIVARESSRVRKRYQGVGTASYDVGCTVDSTAGLDIWRALAQLSPPLRDVTVLFYFDDLKTEEIAAALGIAHATVRTRLARSRERLRALLGDYDLEPQTFSKGVRQHAC